MKACRHVVVSNAETLLASMQTPCGVQQRPLTLDLTFWYRRHNGSNARMFEKRLKGYVAIGYDGEQICCGVRRFRSVLKRGHGLFQTLNRAHAQGVFMPSNALLAVAPAASL
jgi:hypothetical protein